MLDSKISQSVIYVQIICLNFAARFYIFSYKFADGILVKFFATSIFTKQACSFLASVDTATRTLDLVVPLPRFFALSLSPQ